MQSVWSSPSRLPLSNRALGRQPAPHLCRPASSKAACHPTYGTEVARGSTTVARGEGRKKKETNLIMSEEENLSVVVWEGAYYVVTHTQYYTTCSVHPAHHRSLTAGPIAGRLIHLSIESQRCRPVPVRPRSFFVFVCTKQGNRGIWQCASSQAYAVSVSRAVLPGHVHHVLYAQRIVFRTSEAPWTRAGRERERGGLSAEAWAIQVQNFLAETCLHTDP